jgi:phospholipid/cholesterol/gamma-HCH transport system substrate-binding protein
MQRAILDLWVGVFVVAGIAALLVLALKVGSASTTFNTSESYQLYANFENIGGLKVRAPVKSAGVVVGRVDSIEFDNELYKARVGLKVDKRYHFSKDTIASILTSGLLGEQYIGLEGGGEEKMLNEGDTIKMAQSAVVLEKLIGEFMYNKAAEGNNAKSGADGETVK